jgi:hypothetical protein
VGAHASVIGERSCSKPTYLYTCNWAQVSSICNLWHFVGAEELKIGDL